MPNVLAIFGAFVATYVAASICFFLLQTFAGIQISAGGMISIMMAAAVAGQVYARRIEQPPSGGEATGYALAFAGLLVVLSVAQVALAQVDITAIPTVFVVTYAVIAMIGMRIIFPWSIRNELRRLGNAQR